MSQKIFNEETDSIIDRITLLTSLFLGSMELRLSNNIDSVINPLWDNSFTVIKFHWQKNAVVTTALLKFKRCFNSIYYVGYTKES